jgi:hypothetical protein
MQYIPSNIRAAHDLIDSFLEFSNSLAVGHCKHWKATSILGTGVRVA